MSDVTPEAGGRPARWWKTGLMVAGSAVLGGTAVALWNRRTLSKIQENAPARRRSPLHVEAEDVEEEL